MLTRAIVLLGFLASILLPADAAAERRVALVIGNAAYMNAPTLRNPGNDARDVTEALTKLGFEVQFGLDLDQSGFARAIDGFARALEGADVGLLFYAGHGLQMNEKNYLVSTNAQLNSEFLLPSETIELTAIVRLMESKVPVNLVFLDACRNNPLADNLRQSLATTKRAAALGRGLAPIEPSGHDTLIAFAAAPGQEAGDGRGRNSPFTASLLKHILTPGLEVSVMLKEVAADVRNETRNAQRPQQLSDMSRTFYFSKAQTAAPSSSPSPPPPAAAPADDRALDVAFWSSAQTANDCEAVRAYLRRFPHGVFVDLAQLSEKRLCATGRKVTVVEAPPDAAASATAPSVASVPPVAPSVAAVPPVVAPVPPLGSTAEAAAAAPAPFAAPADQIAALPAPAAKADSASGPRPELTGDIQAELLRLGCVSGKAERNWGAQTRAAIARFNRHARAALDSEYPTAATYTALRAHETRVCPLVCGPGFRIEADACVAIAPAQPRVRKADRPPPRHEPAARAASGAAPASRPAAPQARPRAEAASSKVDLSDPRCQSRIQVGNKWCCTYDPPRGPSVIIMCR